MMKKLALLAGPLICVVLLLQPYQIINPEVHKVVAVAFWIILWWISECVSISVTALIPLVFFPLFGIMDLNAVTAKYGSPIVFLFFGGFVMALALEKVGLHKRIALNIVRLTGTTPNKVILGFMLATAFLSMWISNTATTVVMLPIALSVIDLLHNDADGFTKNDTYFSIALMLGIAYSANVGGVATIIGTPPNTVMVGFLEEQHKLNISFFKWMTMGVPFSLLMLALVYFVVVKWMFPNRLGDNKETYTLICSQLDALGKITNREKRVLVIFSLAILLWVFRSSINVWIPSLQLTDTSISLLAAFSLFTLPLWHGSKGFVLEWKDTQKLPWGILILFGGGLALAGAMADSGIVRLIGEAVESQHTWSLFWVGAFLIAVLLFMTELISNVALVSIFCPVIAGIALGLDANLLTLLIPITMASSCAFMLPMATPPNAIVFASGYLEVKQMIRAGIVLNIFSIIILILVMQFAVANIF